MRQAARLSTSAAGRPRSESEHCRAARLGNHCLGIALAQRQCAERKVAGDFDCDPAHAESQRESEIRIARDACEYLDPARDEFLHQQGGVGWSRLKPVEPLLQAVKGAREVLIVRETDGDEAELGLMGNVVR